MRKQLFNECRLTIDLKVPPETRLIVAAADREKQQKPGQNEESGITVPVLDRKENGRPYLPGSSVKGVFRSRAEYIANLINDSLGTCHLLRRNFGSASQMMASLMPFDVCLVAIALACG